MSSGCVSKIGEEEGFDLKTRSITIVLFVRSKEELINFDSLLLKLSQRMSACLLICSLISFCSISRLLEIRVDLRDSSDRLTSIQFNVVRFEGISKDVEP